MPLAGYQFDLESVLQLIALGISLLHAFRDAGARRALVYARGDDEYPVARLVYGALGFRTHGRIVQYRLP